MKRINDGIARGESALAVAMLLFMILVASTQALLRNLTNFGLEWANTALEYIDWADFVNQKGTLWLAFLGASLAAHGDRHIGIDIVPRLVPPRVRTVLHGIVGLSGGVICFYLSRAFWAAVLINGEERPPDYAILTLEGSVHVCDATAQQLAESSMSVPSFFCGVRSMFEAVGATMDTPGAAFQAIAPVMLLFIAVRMFAYGIRDFINLAQGKAETEWRPAEGGSAHSDDGKDA